MIIVDTALQRRQAEGRPVRVGLVGAGYAGRGIARQLLTPLRGIRLTAIANRTLEKARHLMEESETAAYREVQSSEQFDAAAAAGEVALAADASLLTRSEQVDVVIDATGQIEFGARVALDAIENGKHLIMSGAELDSTLGPILNLKADQAGVVITGTDGDEPGVAMNLYRFVKTIGYRPVMAGNIKGFIDCYRTPETQRAFAEKMKQDAPMITSFADGTKLSMETCALANATGLAAGRRGLYGHRCEHVKEIVQHFRPEDLLRKPLVEYALGAAPGTGAFVVGYNDEPVKQQYMSYFKMGDGPLYVFYTPFHLPQLQVAVTIGRVALFHDAAVAPLGAPVCSVAAVAKRDLKAGETLDGIGGFCCYGQIDNAADLRAQKALPMGLSEGCRLTADVPKDQIVTYDDIQIPPGRLCDRLWTEQCEVFSDAEPPAPAAIPQSYSAAGEKNLA
jgi:predicted homoserine dehydrogenase-like protein